MAAIKAIEGWEEKYPAFKWCADYGDGWYLPALNELHKIYTNREVVNATLESYGYTGLNFSYYYWSSTEADNDGNNIANVVSLGDDRRVPTTKDSMYIVRAVLSL
jgi:hypothetical protein